jgi:hypothetical protein
MSISEAEEVPFQLLHGELVKHVLTRTGNDRVKALSDVESIGNFNLNFLNSLMPSTVAIR